MEEKIDKLKTAEDQLRTAIDLFFNEQSPVAIHNLTHASHEILDSLCNHRGLEGGIIREGFKKYIKPEHHKTVHDKVMEAKNFFKHADRNPEDVLVWNSKVSEYFIWDAISLYSRLTGEYKLAEFIIFSLWFRMNHEDLWENSLPLDNLLPGIEDLRSISKINLYKIAMEGFKKGIFRLEKVF